MSFNVLLNLTLMKINDLEAWFKDRYNSLPEHVWLDKITKVNTRKMIAGHMNFLRANPGNRTFLPYWERLILLKSILESG